MNPSNCVHLLAFFHLIWGEGPDIHDDVQTVAERSPRKGETDCTDIV